MTRELISDTFSGPCVEGPLRGKLLATHGRRSYPIFGFEHRDDHVPAKVIGVYRWSDAGKYWKWHEG